MRIIRDLKELTAPLPGAVVTIGNFDGIHLGHRDIFRKVVEKARSIGGTAVAVTFEPHPLKVMAPERAPLLISTLAEKERLIAASCVDVLVCLPFTEELASLPAERFVDEILVGRIGVRHLVVGYDYAFGRGRRGDAALLRKMGAEHGYSLEVLEPIAKDGAIYSSTRIRALIGAGEVAEVVKDLGRHYTLEGEVVSGARRGKGLGFPTANLSTEKELLPRTGVYAVKVRLDEETFDAVANIGYNPTFGESGISVEVHILDFEKEIYGRKLRIYFVERLREEATFAGAAELIAAIKVDIARARKILRRARIIEYGQYLDCSEDASAPLSIKNGESE